MNKLTILLLVVLTLALAACGGQDTTEQEPTEAPAQEAVQEATDVPPTAAPPTEAPPTEVPPTEEPAAAEKAEEEVPESGSPLDTMEHIPDPNLVNITWEWERREPNGNDIPEIIVPNPENYSLFFNEDGTFNATLDCNSASGSYKTPTPGNIFMELGPMTMAACEEGSLADDMANMFGPAQSYRLEDDNDVLVMVWVAGGPLDYFRNAEAVVEGEEEVTGIPEDAIQMDLQGLAATYEWQVIPASPIPPGPGGKGFPPHILMTFDGAKPEDVIPNSGPYMYIFPTQAYINLYLASGSSIVADQVAKLEQLIATAEGRQELPESPMPLLPPPNTFMDRWVQYLDLNFAVGEGVRYVSDSPFRQDKGPWTNDTTGYYYQGLTTDGTFYVSLFWPVSTESLPNTVEDVPEDVNEAAQNPETSDAYQQETKDTLNALATSDWDPDLARLDAMMASLTFPTPEAEGEEETPNGEDEEVDLPAPDDGEATGTITAPDGVYIRTGPGTEYPDVGAAPFGETGTIVGVSEDGEWWVMEVPVTPETPDGQGWVSAQYVDASNAENVPVVPAPEQQPALTGKTWQWVSLTDPQGLTAVPNPANYTILFNEDGSANIQADCNQVGGTYTTNESSISITLGPTTAAACGPDSLDQVYLAGLGNAAIYFFEEGDLYIDMQADGGTMRFSAASGTAPSPTPSPDEPADGAAGIQFNLVSFGPVGAEQAIIPGSEITATFTDTEVSGFSGCNNYSAALTPVDDYFTVGPITSTQQTCDEPAGVMEQEIAYLTALGGTSGYRWEEGLVDNTALVTAGQVFYVLTDGTSGVLNYVTIP
jgi:heat shock protein HslJ